MRLALVQPPHIDLTLGPPLAIPTLSAVLQQHGVDVAALDLAAMTLGHMLGRSWLDRSVGRARRLLTTSSDRGAQEAVALSDYLLEQIEPAVLYLKSSRDPTAEQVRRSRRLINQALRVASCGYPGTAIKLSGSVLPWSPARSEEVFAAIESPDNIYSDLYERVGRQWFLEVQPDVTGISILYEQQLIPALTLARKIRNWSASSRIVVGGTYVSKLRHTPIGLDVLLRFVDGICLFEGEKALPRYLDALNSGTELSTVPNWVWTDSNGDRTMSPCRSIDVSSIPTPDYSALSPEPYLTPVTLPVQTARGCSWGRCRFCTIPDGGRHDQSYSPRPLELVAEDIRVAAVEHKCVNLLVIDQGVPWDRARQLAAIIRNVAAAEAGPVNWMFWTRGDSSPTPAEADALAASGCRMISPGIESGSCRVLSAMDKGVDLDHVETTVNMLAARGVAVLPTFIAGYPGETADDVHQTSDLIGRLADKLAYPVINRFILERGSRLARSRAWCREHRVRTPPGEDMGLVLDWERPEDRSLSAEIEALERRTAALFPDPLASSFPVVGGTNQPTATARVDLDTVLLRPIDVFSVPTTAGSSPGYLLINDRTGAVLFVNEQTMRLWSGVNGCAPVLEVITGCGLPGDTDVLEAGRSVLNGLLRMGFVAGRDA